MNNLTIKVVGLFSIFMLSLNACASNQEIVNTSAAPVLLPGTIPEMNSAGFWIGIHPNPDKVVIPSDDISAFNKSIQKEIDSSCDITSYPGTIKGKLVSKSLKNTLRYIISERYIQQDGKIADASFFHDIEEQMDIPSIPSKVGVRFGFVTSYTPQRILPTNTALFSNMKSMDIDRLQNSAMDIGTPIAILHSTRDGRWVYAVTPLSEGWMKSENVGSCSLEQMKSYLSEESFIVTIGTKADLFLDESLRKYYTYVRMGCRFPTEDPNDPRSVKIRIPFRDKDGRIDFKKAFVSSSDISSGYLPYTPRTIINQAFKLLNYPYGWGDMYGEQDCSRFLQEIFATVGIQLPRNSAQQARVGRLIAKLGNTSCEDKRFATLPDSSIAGVSILHMNGHIMLFLGNFKGNAFAIHDMRGYSEPGPDGEHLRLVNRVVVSNLHIGEGSKKGCFLKRLVTIRAFMKTSS